MERIQLLIEGYNSTDTVRVVGEPLVIPIHPTDLNYIVENMRHGSTFEPEKYLFFKLDGTPQNLPGEFTTAVHLMDAEGELYPDDYSYAEWSELRDRQRYNFHNLVNRAKEGQMWEILRETD